MKSSLHVMYFKSPEELIGFTIDVSILQENIVNILNVGGKYVLFYYK